MYFCFRVETDEWQCPSPHPTPQFSVRPSLCHQRCFSETGQCKTFCGCQGTALNRTAFAQLCLTSKKGDASKNQWRRGGLNNYHISTSMLTPGLQLQLFVHLGVRRTGRQGQILLRSLTFHTRPTHSSVAIRGHACLPAWPSPLLLCTNILATRRSHSYTEWNLVRRSIFLRAGTETWAPSEFEIAICAKPHPSILGAGGLSERRTTTAAFWYVMLRRLTSTYQRFGGTCHFKLQGRGKINSIVRVKIRSSNPNNESASSSEKVFNKTIKNHILTERNIPSTTSIIRSGRKVCS